MYCKNVKFSQFTGRVNEDFSSASQVVIVEETVYTMRASDDYPALPARLRLDPCYKHIELNVIDASIPVVDRLFTVVHSRSAHTQMFDGQILPLIAEFMR